jgi:hypothetical protein
VSAYGTVTRLAPAGRHPPKPSHQTKSFKKTRHRALGHWQGLIALRLRLPTALSAVDSPIKLLRLPAAS